MAQAAKKVRRQAGDDYQTKAAVGVPPNVLDLAVAIKQLQDTVNELIARYNVHTHSANGTATLTLVTGTAQAATNLFVNADQ
jgi:hypothetical protein